MSFEAFMGKVVRGLTGKQPWRYRSAVAREWAAFINCRVLNWFIGLSSNLVQVVCNLAGPI